MNSVIKGHDYGHSLQKGAKILLCGKARTDRGHADRNGSATIY